VNSNIQSRIPDIDYDVNFKTILPLNLDTIISQPTSENNGIITLLISGGTRPYKINWDNGFNGDTLSNVGFGEYNVTVTDYYNDFTITRTIVVEDESLIEETQSEEIRLSYKELESPIDENPNLCLTNGKENYPIIYQGNNVWSNGDINLMYSEKNKRWEISGVKGNTIIKIDKNKQNNPFNGKWSLKGEKWKVIKGDCGEIKRKIKTLVNDETCYGLKDGAVKILIDNGDYRDYQFRIRGVKPYPMFSNNNIFNNLSSDNYLVEAKKDGQILKGEFNVKEGKGINIFNVNLTKTDEINNNDNKVKDYRLRVTSDNEINNDEIIVKLKLTHIVKYNCPLDGCLITPDAQVVSEGFNLIEENEFITSECDDENKVYLKTYVDFKEVTISDGNDYLGTISHNINTFDYTWSDCQCKSFIDSKVKLEIVKSYVNDGLCNKVNNMGEVISMIYLQNCIKE
jgi:hypothetical protein